MNLGLMLLGIWLIIYGLAVLLGLTFSGFPVIMAVLAVISGVLILLKK